MPILKDLAQVLRIYEQGNTSLVAVMLGRRLGQFRVYLKGGRRWPKKGFEGGFDLLARGEMLVYPRTGDGLWNFREWDERARPRIGQSLGMLRIGSFLCELGEALTRATSGSIRDDGADTALYEALCSAADALESGTHPGHVALRFTLRALAAEALLPDLKICAQCEKNLLKETRPLWLTQEGLLCATCHAPLPGQRETNQRVPLQKSAPGNAAQRSTPARSNFTTANAQFAPRGREIPITPQALRVLQHYAEEQPQKPVRFNRAVARQLAQSLILLVHSALEHDLRTLHAAARAVNAAGKDAK